MRNILFLLVITIISGCTAISGYYEADPLFKQQSDLLDDKIDIVDVDKLETRVSAATTPPLRNQLLEELLTISDRSCARHQASIIATVNTWNVSTGSISSLLSAVATVAGGESAKAALSAGAAFTNSSRSLVNEEVYAKAIGPTIVRATVSAREKKMAEINKGMKETLSIYSVQQGLRDVYDYQNRCSFYYGLLEITKAIDERKRTRAEVQEALQLLKSEATDLKNNGRNTTKIDSRIEALSLELETAPY